ncbi:hypothetical protein M0R45_031089 [Rubus argutus]|uniref:Uncharacterized protein n=1 Tax=Rubus argutus TaxID=59490 RepID=A0AAW1WGH1_RUBAR
MDCWIRIDNIIIKFWWNAVYGYADFFPKGKIELNVKGDMGLTIGLAVAAVLYAGLKGGLAAMLDGYPLRGGVPLDARLLLEDEGP